MTDRFHDFDAAFAEEEASPLAIRLFGREWELPADPPADALLRQQRIAVQVLQLQKAGKLDLRGMSDDADVPDELLAALGGLDPVEHARQLCGEDNVDAWLAEGIGQKQLQAVVSWVTRQHNGQGEPVGNREARRKAGRKKAPAKGQASKTSSSSGRSSKRTSSASTGST